MFKKIKSLIEENRGYHKKNQELLYNLYWAHIYHDSIRGKEWLEKLPLNIGRMAGDYNFFYLLNRILNDYKPKNILEFGLGESSKFISEYLANELLDSSHTIIEQDEKWKHSFEGSWSLSKRSNIIVCPVQKTHIKGHETNSYSNLKDKINNKFDLYIIDGPKGSEHYSRYDIVSLAKELEKKDEFIIIMDDYNREGEKQTIADLFQLFDKKGINAYKRNYLGTSNVILISTEKYKYATTL